MKFTITVDDSIVEACCDFPDGVITLPLLKYKSLIDDPTFVSNPDKPNIVANKIANPISAEENLRIWLGSVCDILIQKKIACDGDALVVAAEKKHLEEMNTLRDKAVQDMLSTVSKTTVS